MQHEGNEPASPVTTETVTHATQQHAGLSKRDAAAIASLQGQRASGIDLPSYEVARLAWADADALFSGGAK